MYGPVCIQLPSWLWPEDGNLLPLLFLPILLPPFPRFLRPLIPQLTPPELLKYLQTGWIGTVEVNRDAGLEPGETFCLCVSPD